MFILKFLDKIILMLSQNVMVEIEGGKEVERKNKTRKSSARV